MSTVNVFNTNYFSQFGFENYLVLNFMMQLTFFFNFTNLIKDYLDFNKKLNLNFLFNLSFIIQLDLNYHYQFIFEETQNLGFEVRII